MDTIKLKRGQREVVFKKVPTQFAVRLKHGRARSSTALENSLGRVRANIEHIDALAGEQLDVFAVDEARQLEATMEDLRRAPASDVVTHMYELDDVSASAVVPTGKLTLQFKPHVDDKARLEVFREFCLQVVEELDFLPDAYTVRLTAASQENPLKIAAKLQQRSDILTAEPDLGFRHERKYRPADPRYRDQWHLHNAGDAPDLAAGADVKAEEAWNYTRGVRDIRVCVIDDGFDLDHPDFASPGKIVAPKDFGQGDDDPRPFRPDDHHGTACAGVAVADENGSGGVGLAPNCAFMPVRMAEWLTDDSVVQMFRYVIDQRADVVSCSWSAAAWNFPLSTKIHAIIHQAATQGRRNRKGCVILFAAGNEDRPLDGQKNGQISHQGFALHPDVIAVAASNSLDQRSFYSNYGPQLAIAAPSSGAPGRGIVTTDRSGAQGYGPTDYTSDFGGTSSATPLAAGLAALMLSLDPNLSSADVKRIMQQTADKIDPQRSEYRNGHSQWLGAGRINAARALAAITGRDTVRPPQTLLMEHRIHRAIPDVSEVGDTIAFPLEAAISGIEVSVDIRHTYSGDLRLVLKTPHGNEILLQDRVGGPEDNVVRAFRSADEPTLFAAIIGKAAKGNWTLRVIDTAREDVGVLVKWGVAISY